MIPSAKLGLEDGELLQDTKRYSCLVGKINYLTITRPNITFPINEVSQFMNSPRTFHWNAIVHILSYLKKPPRYGILYKNHGHCIVEDFFDAVLTRCLIDQWSTSKYYVFVDGNFMTQKSKKQAIVF